MEEWVGSVWDRFIRRTAYRGFPDAVVTLDTVREMAAPYFRALGGNPALSIKSGTALAHGGARRWLEKIAGTGLHSEFAWCDGQCLYLPEKIDHFSDVALNRELYLWLATLAAFDTSAIEATVFNASPRHLHGWQRNVIATRAALAALPGWKARYIQLVEAHLALRTPPEKLHGLAAVWEQRVREQLRHPENDLVINDTDLDTIHCHVWPIALWLRLDMPAPVAPRASGDPTEEGEGNAATDDNGQKRFRAKQVELPEKNSGMLMLFRAESIFSWNEYVRVNRPCEDDDNADNALQRANDMEYLSVTRQGKAGKSRVRFDLDLPAPDIDDFPLGPGVHVPEWNFRTQTLQDAFCCIEPLLPRATPLEILPAALRSSAARLRRQFEALAAQPAWRNKSTEGEELDLDACLQFMVARHAGEVAEPDLWRSRVTANRSLACLLLADVSLSTDTWVGERRVIDVIRDSLYLFAEAMSATLDAFGIYGFSSVKRQHVRFHLLKDFSEKYDARVRGRIAALKPGFYTRLGAAIRHSTTVLRDQPAEKRLLLVLTDGKPNDIDHYEGRYGIEDTRNAVLAAREQGLTVFCITVDKNGAEYLPYLFGTQGCVVVQNANDLPRLLPRLYVQLTRRS